MNIGEFIRAIVCTRKGELARSSEVQAEPSFEVGGIGGLTEHEEKVELHGDLLNDPDRPRCGCEGCT